MEAIYQPYYDWLLEQLSRAQNKGEIAVTTSFSLVRMIISVIEVTVNHSQA